MRNNTKTPYGARITLNKMAAQLTVLFTFAAPLSVQKQLDCDITGLSDFCFRPLAEVPKQDEHLNR